MAPVRRILLLKAPKEDNEQDPYQQVGFQSTAVEGHYNEHHGIQQKVLGIVVICHSEQRNRMSVVGSQRVLFSIADCLL